MLGHALADLAAHLAHMHVERQPARLAEARRLLDPVGRHRAYAVRRQSDPNPRLVLPPRGERVHIGQRPFEVVIEEAPLRALGRAPEPRPLVEHAE